MMIHRILSLLVALATCALVLPPAKAQTTNASITGVITDDAGGALPGATILVKNESTGFSTGTVTNVNGEFTLKQLPLGGPYSVSISSIGFGTEKRTGYMLNQSDILHIDMKMNPATEALATVEVNASSLQNQVGNFGASTSVTARDIAKLPVNGRNFTTLIDLSPLSRGGNISGQLASSVNFTIDGMTAKNPTSGGTTNRNGGPYAISMEAVREFNVVTNQYDVTYGRSGGGTVSTVTKSGTNTFSGSAFTYMRTNGLSSKYDIRGNKRDVEFSTYQYGFTLGGPIVKDKAHFFVVWDHQADARPLQIADIQSPADEARLNITQATLDQFLGIAREQYGVANSPQFGSFDKKRGTDAVFARVDWQINKNNLLTIRDNFVYDMNNLGLDDNSAINMFEVYGNVKSIDNSILATLRSAVTPRFTNELKLQHLYTLEESSPGDQLPGANIPRAIVQNVGSTIGDKTVFTTIQLGGQRFSPEHFYNHVVQLVDNVYYTTDKINFTFGADLMYSHLNSLYGSEMNGRFYFTGMENFANATPYRYAREIALSDDHSVQQNILNTALYAQLQTGLAPGLDMMLGVRADYSSYMDKANFNPVVYEELGLRTDNGLSTFQVQPRVQFTWDVNQRQRDFVRLGAGIFGSDINNYAMINNMLFDGTKVLSVDVQGALVPAPNFPGYREDPSTAPGRELFDAGVPALATINTNGKDARVPVIYKANLSYNRIFNDRLKMGISGFMSLGRNNYMYVDRNMADNPFFTLSNEGGRAVYVPAESITTTNGATNWMNGRKTTRVGRVLELTSEGKVNHFAAVADATFRYFKDGEITVSYTWSDIRDNTSYNGNVANSATLSLMVKDDPRDLSRMTYSDNQFRNKVVFYGTLPTFYGVSVGVRYSGIGGTRYSLAVSGNPNGDFVDSNDLAYVFDPNDPAVAEKYRTAINAILANPKADGSLKDYIRNSAGKIAERNGGENGFYGVWDLRIGKRFKLFRTQALELSADIFNVANMLKKDWGTTKTLGKQNLYTVTGFDADTRNFNYNVNANAGVITPSGNPFQVQLGARYTF
ncbi:carboxypeptidase regulatory-like domain-containing protein [Parachryseolinea silvisoli]|uniref:carboxypeptidase regulatory-like domain-containing protein n=1 Tax=Parachryseolinea silvisoli TaxID=2873601 RepID=UPI002265B55A|nr:carboxypeptidase regulatory-like domain-containing protein [Parachryseolinea silvisoli]MCD9015508.1 carboxypeptidase regulatory-like domain-containing protein [Parachryseolinea silvisoli]